MTTTARPLKLYKFGGNNPLELLRETTQVQYLKCYLGHLQAAIVLEEPNYFDRDYLAEFSAFYSISSRGYPNLCRRLHFFSDSRISRDAIRKAAGGNQRSLAILQNSYLGFVVLRPIPGAPLGRTVLKWYPDPQQDTPRVVAPSRDYIAHVAGFELIVHGLAWQQQDSAVGACATIGLWSMLHSSAFDDHHAIPTTADITRSAHRRASLGSRIFPSGGLNIYQICEAIKEQNLSPVIIESDITNDMGEAGISSERFASTSAAFLRSAYPVLLIGKFEGTTNGHAICAVGFRSRAQPDTDRSVNLEDAATEYLYIHDDNLGPNVRFRIHHECARNHKGEVYLDKANNPITWVYLKPDSPHPHQQCPTDWYPRFKPQQIIVAVHNDLRTSPDKLHDTGLEQAQAIGTLFSIFMSRHGLQYNGVTLSTRFIKLSSYLGKELDRLLHTNPKALSKVRMKLCEQVQPMSLHIGVVRIGADGSTPLIDILYDTTDSDLNHPVFAHIVYHPNVAQVTEILARAGKWDFGTLVEGW